MTKRVEINNKADLRIWAGLEPRPAADFINLNLIGIGHLFEDSDLPNCAFINCKMGDHFSKRVNKFAGFNIAANSNNLFSIYPSNFYTPQELYDACEQQSPYWLNCKDAKIYHWFINGRQNRLTNASSLIATRAHDSAMERHIYALIASHVEKFDMLPVAIMGGHNKKRTDKSYQEVAILSRALARRNHLIISGGGPGLMEAANLGAFLAPFDDDRLDWALEILGDEKAQDYKNNPEGWLNAAVKVVSELKGGWLMDAPSSSTNIGIPTYYYGHEPSNVFATHIAKFFHNSLREDGLVSIADGGIIFAEGNAGTVQEIFQDACQNYYRPKDNIATPMVLFSSTKDYWERDCTILGDKINKTKSLRPLLLQMASERNIDEGFTDAILFSENIDEILEYLKDYHHKHIDEVTLGHYRRLANNGLALGDPEI